MKKSYNLKAIMGRAWAIRKAAAAELQGVRNRFLPVSEAGVG